MGETWAPRRRCDGSGGDDEERRDPVAQPDLPGVFVTRKIHALDDHRVVNSTAHVSGHDTGPLTETLTVNHLAERDGQIARVDRWEIEDLPLALDRFDRWQER